MLPLTRLHSVWKSKPEMYHLFHDYSVFALINTHPLNWCKNGDFFNSSQINANPRYLLETIKNNLFYLVKLLHNLTLLRPIFLVAQKDDKSMTLHNTHRG